MHKRNIILVAALATALPAFGARVKTVMNGHIAEVHGTPPPGVDVGDPLRFVFTYDPAKAIESEVIVGDVHYFLFTNDFKVSLRGWRGSLVDYIADVGPRRAEASFVSWQRPVGTLHHEEWSVGFGAGLYLITNYEASAGESYGWYSYGSDQIGLMFDSVVTQPVHSAGASPVPEPGTLTLMLIGLGFVAARGGYRQWMKPKPL